MIFGIGTDIVKVSRFQKWVSNPEMLKRFFNEGEFFQKKNSVVPERVLCEHFAARFAAKEAFAKALGTGFVGPELKDFWVKKNSEGKPDFEFGESTLKILNSRIGRKFKVHLSISHEAEFATAFVIIEEA